MQKLLLYDVKRSSGTDFQIVIRCIVYKFRYESAIKKDNTFVFYISVYIYYRNQVISETQLLILSMLFNCNINRKLSILQKITLENGNSALSGCIKSDKKQIVPAHPS